jgi:hypothetical protein
MKSLYENIFSIGTDFKTTFSNEVDKLIAQDLTVEFKNKLVQGLTDAYVDQTGKVPDSYELERLATWIVEDKSRDPDKVTNTEYPVLSQGQIKLRHRRELVNEHIAETSNSTKHKINGKRKPKNFKVFGEYEGGY